MKIRRNKLRRRTVLALCMALMLVFSGCGRKEREETILIKPDGEEHPVSAVEMPENGDAARTVYLIVPSNEGPSVTETRVISEAAFEAGVSLKVLNYMNDPIAEANAMEQAAAAGAALIICDNIDENFAVRGIRSAKEKNIPVFLMGRGVEAVGMASYQVLTESYTCVRRLGEEYAEREKKKGSGYVMLKGSGTAADLADAFSSVMLGKNGIRELESVFCDEYDAMEAYNTAWDLLNAHRDADTVVCGNTVQTQAALDAQADLGLSLSVICLNGDTDRIVQYVEEGKILAAIVKPASALAGQAGAEMKNYLESGELPYTESYYVQGEIRMNDGEE